MTKLAFAARRHIGTLVLGTLVILGLTACGADESASSASAAGSTMSARLVSPEVGMIDRTPPRHTPGTPPPAVSTTPPSNTPTGSSNGGGSVKPGPAPVPVASGSATLDWTPPTQNSDGSALTNLAGYTVYYGTAPDRLTESVKVANPGLSAYTLSNLPSGTWYFAVSSYSSTGVESARSPIISTRI